MGARPVTDRPIIFSAPMVRALLDGRKTQTRRLASSPLRRCEVGDRLWVRESIRLWADIGDDAEVTFLADKRRWHTGPCSGEINDRRLASYFKLADRAKDSAEKAATAPSIHMPRWASRLTLIVEAVRVEPLHDISEADAIGEGCEPLVRHKTGHAVEAGFENRIGYALLWNTLHTEAGERWQNNPDARPHLPRRAREHRSGGRMMLRYLDVCSGISAPTMAWKPLGWQAACYAEIEAAPRAVLAHHYPDVPLVGDFTTIKGDEYGPVDLLVGGTPCQSFSVAGLRGGLDDDRGNLALEYLRLADRARPRWLVWENVLGVLSSGGGRDFGAILGGMGELGYGFAYRVLDAQYFGVPQQRRRVILVGYSGDWRRSAAVLFDRLGREGNTSPEGGIHARPARTLTRGAMSKGKGGYAGRRQEDDCNIVLHSNGALRHFTPLEKERLMGFPDGFTAVPFRSKLMADGPRCQVLGNSMAVPVVRWIGERIAAVDALSQRIAA
jgi:site-specific DNA-cytosine methylase